MILIINYILLMQLPNISIEQENIVKSIHESKNVIVESVAGSGKTTSNIYIAKLTNKSILLLTYNTKLKMETREKIYNLDIQNMEVHSYHSFCVKNYNHKCFTDYEIINIIKNDTIVKKKFKYDLLILDEAQDITPLYHQLICKIYKDNSKTNCQICLLGDRAQSIYDFNRADSRFIIYADQIFNLNNFEWNKISLSESYRITHEMAQFINHCMSNKFNITSNKISGIKPKYLITDSFSDSVNCKQFIELQKYLKKYRPEEIFILAPSVKNQKSPVRQFENLIKKNLKNVQVYVPITDEEKLDEEILKNKLVFSTFHQAKGLERKVVFIYGFDNSYFKFFKKDKNPKICPNELYVAVTRALEHLVIIHGINNEYLDFLNIKLLDKYANVISDGPLKINKYKVTKTFEISVTDLIKHLPVDVLDNCIKYLTIENIKAKNQKISIPYKSKQSKGVESISEITGTAIPSYLEYKKTGKMTIYNESLTYDNKNDEVESPEFIDSDNDTDNKQMYDLKKINLSKLKTDELLFIANYYCSKKSGFLYKICQITDYNWLTQENLDLSYLRLNNLGISNKAKYEQYFEVVKYPELLDKRLYGYIDCIDDIETNNVYEFKCVKKLENEHYLQLAVYMYLYEITKKKEIESNNTMTIIRDVTIDTPGLTADMLAYINFNKKKIEKEKDPIKKIELENITNKMISRVSKELNVNKSKIINNIVETKERNYYLYNILTDQMDKISCEFNKLKEMIEYLFQSKYLNQNQVPDNIFIEKCITTLQHYRSYYENNLHKQHSQKEHDVLV